MSPIIGITMSVQVGAEVGTTDKKELFVSREHSDAVIAAGGLPFFLPFTTDAAVIDQYVQQVDGLLLTGGWDMDPAYYGEEPAPALGVIAPSRDETELALAKAFLAAGKPILGICRGHQLLAVALGCTLYQDLDSQYEGAFNHHPPIPRNRPMHAITITESSLMHQILGETTIRVNSMHHQAVKDIGESVRVTAVASDGVVEAIESTRYPNVLGVQYHPECMAEEANEAQVLFDWLVRESQADKQIHGKLDEPA